MMSYYDIILGFIPLTLFGISSLLWLTGVPFTMAVPAGALIAVGLIGHALFVNGPGKESATAPVSTSSPSTNSSASMTSE